MLKKFYANVIVTQKEMKKNVKYEQLVLVALESTKKRSKVCMSLIPLLEETKRPFVFFNLMI